MVSKESKLQRVFKKKKKKKVQSIKSTYTYTHTHKNRHTYVFICFFFGKRKLRKDKAQTNGIKQFPTVGGGKD